MTARELEERQNYSTSFTLDDTSTLLRRRYWLKLTMKHPERIDDKEKEKNMSECSMKIQCNNCIHEEVCCLKGTLLDTKNELEHIEIPAFLHPIKLECTHYSPKNRTFTK